MTDIYRVAVHLGVYSNAQGFFTALANTISHTYMHAAHLETTLQRISRMSLIGGTIMAGAGIGILGALKKSVDAAAELNKQLTSTGILLANTSAAPGQSQALQAQALRVARATASQVKGVGYDKSVEIFNETYSIMGAKNAERANSLLAMYAKITGAASDNPDAGFDGIRDLVKSGEMTGKLMNEKTGLLDVDKLEKYLGFASKFSAASAGRINSRTFFQLAQQGSTAIRGMDDEGLQSLLMASQQMGGFRVGTATQSMLSQFAGGKMTSTVADELERLGLVGAHHKQGGGVVFDKGGLDTEFTRKLGKDPMSAIETLRNAMSSHGIQGEEAQIKEMFSIFGRQTVQRLMTDFFTNFNNMVQEKGRVQGAMGLKGQNEARDSQDYENNMHNLEMAWHNLMATFGLSITKDAIGIIQLMTDKIRSWDDALQKMDPAKLTHIGEGIAALGVALVGAGGVALLAALGPAGWVVLGIGAVTAVLIAFKPQLDNFQKQAWQFTEDVRLFVVGLGKEIAGWPDKLSASIASFGTAIVDRIKGIFSKIAGWLSGGNPAAGVAGGSPDTGALGLEQQSYDGSGFGKLLKLASFGDAANDNKGMVGVAGGISGGINNSNVVILGGGGAGGIGGFGGGGGGSGSYSGGALPVGAGSGVGHIASKADRAAFIRATAAKYGISPEIALRVAQSEGFNVFTGDHGTSFGDFQMHIGGGLGDHLRRMGINPADPHNWKQSDEFALKWASTHGWGDWHGAARVGIGRMQGIGRPPVAGGTVVHHTTIQLDGKTISKKVTKHQMEAGLFPTGVGAMNGRSSYMSPGTPINDAA